MELVVSLAIFALLLLIVVALENQMTRIDRSFRIRFMVHPEEMAVIARVNKDVLDAQGYPTNAGDYTQTPTSLILYEIAEDNTIEEVVYDFATVGLVRRLTFKQNVQVAEWMARGVPRFQVSSFTMPDDSVAVRLRGYDTKGKLLVDRIMLPRRED